MRTSVLFATVAHIPLTMHFLKSKICPCTTQGICIMPEDAHTFSLCIFTSYNKHNKSLNSAICCFCVDVANLKSYWQNVYHYADLSPPPDDSLVSLASSLARMSAKSLVLKTDGNGCFIHPGNVLEVTSYHNNDNYKVCNMIQLLVLETCGSHSSEH